MTRRDSGDTQLTVWYCACQCVSGSGYGSVKECVGRACMCVPSVLVMGNCPEEEERLLCHGEGSYKEISSHAIGGSCFQEQGPYPAFVTPAPVFPPSPCSASSPHSDKHPDSPETVLVPCVPQHVHSHRSPGRFLSTRSSTPSSGHTGNCQEPGSQPLRCLSLPFEA